MKMWVTEREPARPGCTVCRPGPSAVGETAMDLCGPTMVTAGRSTPCTMEPCQKNLHPLDGEHQQAQASKSRSLHVVCFLYVAWGYFPIENSIQVRERTVRDGLYGP